MSMSIDEAARGMGSSGPDPSNATLSLMTRQIDSLKELFEQRIASIDKAIEVAHADAERWPTSLDREITALKEFMGVQLKIHDERFIAITMQFNERDLRANQTNTEARTAVAAALQATKELGLKSQEANDRAAAKSESNFSKLIDQQAALIYATKAELATSIDGLKDRLTTVQAMSAGRTESSKDNRESMGAWIAAGGVFIAFLVAMGGLVMFLANRA